MRISLQEAANRLKNGEVVAMPTETVYGLAADASNDIALQQIFAIKQRPADHPLIVHIADIAQVLDWATVFPDVAVKLAKAFWPGPLTLVLPAKPHVSKVVRGNESTVALRIPNHPTALALLKVSGLSLAAPSANLFTQLSPTTAEHVATGLGASMPILDGGACQVGIESTIVSVNAAGQWQLLRPGMISEQQVANVAGTPLNHPIVANAAVESLVTDHATDPTPKVPGQHVLHYAPSTPLVLFTSRDDLMQKYRALSNEKLRCAALLIGEGEQPNCPLQQLANQPHLVAEQLYAALHQLDALKADRLFIELPPNTPEWIAVRDRLIRAGGSSHEQKHDPSLNSTNHSAQ